MLILTNFQRFPEQWTSLEGTTGRSQRCGTIGEFIRALPGADLIIINCDYKLTIQLNVLFSLLPFLRKPVLSHDIVLRRPLTAKARMKTRLVKLLLRGVDHFSLHFRMLEKYQEFFGIGPDRASYLPSKPNIRNRYKYAVSAEGEYILCFGRSERDYDTFFSAMEQLPELPGAIPPPDFAQLARHASRFTRRMEDLPANVKVLSDDGSVESLIGLIEKAKVVVLPILAAKIAPSGIGTYLNAMLMGKCVVISEGPAISDVLTDEAVMVKPEDVGALRDAIRKVWEDEEYRLYTAERGRLYSESCGGEPELRQRVLDRAIEVLWLKKSNP